MQHRGSFAPRSALWGGALALLVALFAPAFADAQQKWGEVKGQVVWGPAKLPVLEKANVDKDKPQCLAKGPIPIEDYVVNPKNKGVQYALVWLVDTTKATAPLPIHPSLKQIPTKPVVIDQPCCRFVPRVTAVREGQPVLVKNPATIPHNFAVTALDLNRLMPAGTDFTIETVKSRPIPIQYSCSIHGWMKGYLASFRHPYFAVTDEDGNFTLPKAPAGKYELVVWQETKGYLFFNPATKKKGKNIEIKADETTDLGKLTLDPPAAAAKAAAAPAK